MTTLSAPMLLDPSVVDDRSAFYRRLQEHAPVWRCPTPTSRSAMSRWWPVTWKNSMCHRGEAVGVSDVEANG